MGCDTYEKLKKVCNNFQESIVAKYKEQEAVIS